MDFRVWQNKPSGQITELTNKAFVFPRVNYYGRKKERYQLFQYLTDSHKSDFIHIHGESGSGKTEFIEHVEIYLNQRKNFFEKTQIIDL